MARRGGGGGGPSTNLFGSIAWSSVSRSRCPWNSPKKIPLFGLAFHYNRSIARCSRDPSIHPSIVLGAYDGLAGAGGGFSYLFVDSSGSGDCYTLVAGSRQAGQATHEEDREAIQARKKFGYLHLMIVIAVPHSKIGLTWSWGAFNRQWWY